VVIKKNHITIDNFAAAKQEEVSGEFSNARLAIAHFQTCETLLKQAITRVQSKSIFKKLTLVMHQQDMNEGGLCEIEERILLEIGYGAGASKVFIWQGEPLNADLVTQKVYEKESK
jgi:rod shape-determining protein MreB